MEGQDPGWRGYAAWLGSTSLPDNPSQPSVQWNGIQDPAGKMVVAKGTDFEISWPFTGMIPLFPLPKDELFKKEKLANFINLWGNELLKKPIENRQGADTYWGGKSMLKTCQAFNMAWQLQLPIANDLYREAKRVVEDWLTYKPGEKAFFIMLGIHSLGPA